MKTTARQINKPSRASQEQSQVTQRNANKLYGVYLAANRSSSTRNAYAADIQRYLDRGGRLPAKPHDVATYLATNANCLSIATLVRQLVAIRHAHSESNFPNPVNDPLVKQTIRGIKRIHGNVQRRARPLMKEMLCKILPKGKSPLDLRDRALLLIGFCGGFRRSELVSLDVEDLSFVDEGLLINLRRSKTDQEGNGRLIAMPFGPRKTCPVLALKAWLSERSNTTGPVFYRLDNAAGTADPFSRLDGAYVGQILRSRLIGKGYDAQGYSAHSLRVGLVTSAAEIGMASWKIRQQTGHKSDVMVQSYIRNQHLFESNTAGVVLNGKRGNSTVVRSRT